MSDNEKAKELISHGAELVGAAAGGALGFYAAGPAGAALGGVAGTLATWTLRKVGQDFANKALSRREEIKVGAGLIYAYTKINQYLEAGRKPRDDEFFKQDASGRSQSDEILEGVLFKCKNEHEEKKLKLVSNIYANVAFRPDVSASGANWLLRKAEELTYRQLCILAIVEQKDVPYTRGPSWGPLDDDPAFEMEYKGLSDMLVRTESSDDAARGHYNFLGEATPVIGLSRIGKFCYEVMGLSEIPEDDLRELALHFPRAFD